MDLSALKKMVVETTEDTIEDNLPLVMSSVEQMMLNEIKSGDHIKDLATWLNKKLNLPVMNEKQEQKFFEDVLSKVQSFFMVLIPKLFKALLKK
tara:strand:- start:1202 stop:1483 length:282 start_codon:yes stop_codon:yes gene_type:complete